MTQQADRSLYEERASTMAGAIGLAAAGLALQTIRYLLSAKRASGLSQREIAKRVGVTEGRVSQVLGGEGNVRVSTLARFMRAMGYVLELTAVPVEPGARPLHPRQRRTRRPIGVDQTGITREREYDVYTQTFLTADGVTRIPVFIPTDDVLGCAPYGDPTYAGRLRISSSGHRVTPPKAVPGRADWRAAIAAVPRESGSSKSS